MRIKKSKLSTKKQWEPRENCMHAYHTMLCTAAAVARCAYTHHVNYDNAQKVHVHVQVGIVYIYIMPSAAVSIILTRPITFSLPYNTISRSIMTVTVQTHARTHCRPRLCGRGKFLLVFWILRTAEQPPRGRQCWQCFFLMRSKDYHIYLIN